MDWTDIYHRLKNDPNDRAAWSALEVSVRGWAHVALRQFGCATVEDAVADTCSTVVLNIDRARAATTFRGFALGIFLNIRRRAMQRGRMALGVMDYVELAAPEPDGGPDPDEIALLQAALDALPARERTALHLRYFEDLSAAEIARALGVTEVNARRIVCNALTHMRRHVAARYSQGGRLCETAGVG